MKEPTESADTTKEATSRVARVPSDLRVAPVNRDTVTKAPVTSPAQQPTKKRTPTEKHGVTETPPTRDNRKAAEKGSLRIPDSTEAVAPVSVRPGVFDFSSTTLLFLFRSLAVVYPGSLSVESRLMAVASKPCLRCFRGRANVVASSRATLGSFRPLM